MSRDPLVEAPIRKHSVSSGQMLLAVQTLFLKGVEVRVMSDLELAAVLRAAHAAVATVAVGFAFQRARGEGFAGVGFGGLSDWGGGGAIGTAVGGDSRGSHGG